MKRFVAALLLLGGLVVAGGASAVTNLGTVSVNCASGSGSFPQFVGSVGDYFTVTIAGGTCNLSDNPGGGVTWSTGANNNPPSASSGSTVTVTLSNDNGGGYFQVVSSNQQFGDFISYVYTQAPTTYTIGGTISGLTGTGLVLTDTSAGSSGAITAGSTSFTLPTAVNSGTSYAVTVQTQPSGQICTLSNETGTVASSNITNVSVVCSSLSTPTLSVTNSPQAYTGSSIAAAVNCSSGGAVSNVLYSGSSSVPSTAGTYAITADCAATGNFLAVTGASAGNFVISQTQASGQTSGGTVNAGIVGGSFVTNTVQFIAPTNPPSGQTFPYDVFGFTASTTVGGSITITLTYPQALAAGTKVWKDLNGTWSDWTNNQINNVTISGNTITYTITDGGPGDADAATNGVIIDPVGIAVPATAVPTLSEWAQLMLALMVIGIAWHFHNNRQNSY